MGVLKGREERFHLQLSTDDVRIKSVALKVLLDACFVSTEQGRAPLYGVVL